METPTFSAGDFTLPNVRRDFPEWHLGRRRYALWALAVDSPSVAKRVLAAQEHLAGLLLDGYCRQPHVTLGLCGFPTDFPCYADDFGPEALHSQLAALRHGRFRPFEIELGGLSSFTSAPYLTVSDAGGELAALHEVLCVAGGGEQDYTPHVTVGLYADAWPIPEVNPRLQSFSAGDPLRLSVTGISLLSYAAQEIGGPLTAMAHYDFDSATLRWQGTPPFPLAIPVMPPVPPL